MNKHVEIVDKCIQEAHDCGLVLEHEQESWDAIKNRLSVAEDNNLCDVKNESFSRYRIMFKLDAYKIQRRFCFIFWVDVDRHGNSIFGDQKTAEYVSLKEAELAVCKFELQDTELKIKWKRVK